jgi:hypothetical protein
MARTVQTRSLVAWGNFGSRHSQLKALELLDRRFVSEVSLGVMSSAEHRIRDPLRVLLISGALASPLDAESQSSRRAHRNRSAPGCKRRPREAPMALLPCGSFLAPSGALDGTPHQATNAAVKSL